MVITKSNFISLGSHIKPFTLIEPISKKKKSLFDLLSKKATLIMFICNHCPFVKHINKEIVNLANEYIPKQISFIAINSNDTKNYPDDSPEEMIKIVKKLNYPFPYLFDESQEVAKNYQAACTPDFFIFNKEKKLVYHGQLDDSRPDNNLPINGKDIRNALNNILKNKKVSTNQKPSIGCNIKWKF